MKERRKKKRRVRSKEWADDHDKAFSHELKRHRRTDTVIHETPARPDIPEDFEPNGVVLSHTKKWAFVLVGGDEERCMISDYLIEDQATLLAAGDQVLVTGDGNERVVEALAPRTSKLSRIAIEHSRVSEQIFAANIDILLVVAATAKPMLKPGLVDRYLITAEVGGVEPVLCINKMDLVDEEPAEVATWRELGIQVLNTSCTTGEGIETLREALRGKLVLFAGHSGVGKSSLLNAMQPGLDLETREVGRSTEKGKHVTSRAHLYTIDGDIRIIDSPGIRQLGIWGVSNEELAYYFPEFAERADACKFRDCTHVHEPKCAVLEAVESGEINRQRYDSYLRIRADLKEREKEF